MMEHPVRHNIKITPEVNVKQVLKWEFGVTNGDSGVVVTVPVNAIYAFGEPIPDPSGGYLTYGDL